MPTASRVGDVWWCYTIYVRNRCMGFNAHKGASTAANEPGNITTTVCMCTKAAIIYLIQSEIPLVHTQGSVRSAQYIKSAEYIGLS